MAKTKLGRNPFEKPAGKTKKKRASAKSANKKGAPSFHDNFQNNDKTPFQLLWRHVTREVLPNVKACAYVRAVGLLSRFAKITTK